MPESIPYFMYTQVRFDGITTLGVRVLTTLLSMNIQDSFLSIRRQWANEISLVCIRDGYGTRLVQIYVNRDRIHLFLCLKLKIYRAFYSK